MSSRSGEVSCELLYSVYLYLYSSRGTAHYLLPQCVLLVHRVVFDRGDLRLYGGAMQSVHEQGVRLIGHQVRACAARIRRQTRRFQR